MLHKWWPFGLIVALVLLLDQVSKNWVVENMFLGQTIEVIPTLAPYFQFTRSANTGAAFGILPSAGPMFLVLSILITLVIVFVVARSEPQAHTLRIALGLIVGGAVGNVVDRLQHGHVVDFFHVMIPQIGLSNVSNFADHAIVLGVIVLLIDSWLRDRSERQASVVTEDGTT